MKRSGGLRVLDERRGEIEGRSASEQRLEPELSLSSSGCAKIVPPWFCPEFLLHRLAGLMFSAVETLELLLTEVFEVVMPFSPLGIFDRRLTAHLKCLKVLEVSRSNTLCESICFITTAVCPLIANLLF